jgi:hypothetical protein
VARRVRAALAPAHRRPLRRIIRFGCSTTISFRSASSPRPMISRSCISDRCVLGLRSPDPRHPLRRRQLGIPHAGRLGTRLGSVAERHGSLAVHLLPAGGRLGLPAGDGRDHLRSRAAGNVHPGQGKHLRYRLDRRTLRRDHLRRCVSSERGGAVGTTTSRRPTRGAAAEFDTHEAPAGVCSTTNWCCPPTSKWSKHRTRSISSTPGTRCPSPSASASSCGSAPGARVARRIAQPRGARLSAAQETTLRRKASSMSERDLLFELGTEELPPRTLAKPVGGAHRESRQGPGCRRRRTRRGAQLRDAAPAGRAGGGMRR